MLSVAPSVGHAAVDAGPIYSRDSWSGAPLDETLAVGPVFFLNRSPSRLEWGVRPLFSLVRDDEHHRDQFDLLYPLVTSRRTATGRYGQILQLIRWSLLTSSSGRQRTEWQVIPLFAYQAATDGLPLGLALFPLYGSLHQTLGQDRLRFLLFPLWLSLERGHVQRRFVLWPVISWASSDTPALRVRGWKFWPLYGSLEIDGQIPARNVVWPRFLHWSFTAGSESAGRLRSRFILWPFFIRETQESAGATRELTTLFPLYQSRSGPDQSSTWWLWPLAFGRVQQHEPDYHQWDLPWPLIQFGDGEKKSISRVFPLYSRRTRELTIDLLGSQQPVRTERLTLLWPLYRTTTQIGRGWQTEQLRLLLFLYVDDQRTSDDQAGNRRRIDLWPLFTYNRAADGSAYFQTLALVETFLSTPGVTRNYSPLWSLATYRRTEDGSAYFSFLWRMFAWNRNTDGSRMVRIFPLVTLRSGPESSEQSFLLGLIQWRSTAGERQLRLFYLPPIRWGRPAATTALETDG